MFLLEQFFQHLFFLLLESRFVYGRPLDQLEDVGAPVRGDDVGDLSGCLESERGSDEGIAGSNTGYISTPGERLGFFDFERIRDRGIFQRLSR